MAADESGLLPIERELENAQELASRLLDNLAQKLHVKRAAHHAAAGVQRAAHYVQVHSTKDMASAVERVVRQRPGASLVLAAAAGFLVGCALRPKSMLR
jgi:ElaB/YqjD/DUF883 family membrane-anchored ribosome-binding protein